MRMRVNSLIIRIFRFKTLSGDSYSISIVIRSFNISLNFSGYTEWDSKSFGYYYFEGGSAG